MLAYGTAFAVGLFLRLHALGGLRGAGRYRAIPKIDDGPWPRFPSDLMSIAIVVACHCVVRELVPMHVLARARADLYPNNLPDFRNNL